MAQNILTFLGYDAIFLIGSYKKTSINDFYNPINVYDKTGEVVSKQPYQVKINSNDIDLFLQGLRPLVLKEYKRILTNHLYQQVNTDDYRTYILNEIYN